MILIEVACAVGIYPRVLSIFDLKIVNMELNEENNRLNVTRKYVSSRL